MVRPKVYPDELRERAVRLLHEWRQACIASLPPLMQQAHSPLSQLVGIHLRSDHGTPSFLHGMEPPRIPGRFIPWNPGPLAPPYSTARPPTSLPGPVSKDLAPP